MRMRGRLLQSEQLWRGDSDGGKSVASSDSFFSKHTLGTAGLMRSDSRSPLRSSKTRGSTHEVMVP